LLELSFAESDELKRFTCDGCSELNQKQRKCADDGFANVLEGREIKINDSKFRFCPGKATWYPDIMLLYQQCELASLTGIMPDRGELKDQDGVFADTFPYFAKRWTEKWYQRHMRDISGMITGIAQSIFGKGKPSGPNKNNPFHPKR